MWYFLLATSDYARGQPSGAVAQQGRRSEFIAERGAQLRALSYIRGCISLNIMMLCKVEPGQVTGVENPVFNTNKSYEASRTARVKYLRIPLVRDSVLAILGSRRT